MDRHYAALLSLAKERKLPVNDRMTYGELTEHLAPTPPSNAQLDMLMGLVDYRGHVETFGEARKIIDEFVTQSNLKTLERLRWEKGDVLLCKGEHWIILEVYDASSKYKIRLGLVDLWADGKGGTHAIRTVGVGRQRRQPYLLYCDGARKLDLTVWPPVALDPPAEA